MFAESYRTELKALNTKFNILIAMISVALTIGLALGGWLLAKGG